MLHRGVPMACKGFGVIGVWHRREEKLPSHSRGQRRKRFGGLCCIVEEGGKFF